MLTQKRKEQLKEYEKQEKAIKEMKANNKSKKVQIIKGITWHAEVTEKKFLNIILNLSSKSLEGLSGLDVEFLLRSLK